MNQLPTVFHITHWKAGSQWVREVLKHCAPDRFVPQELGMVQFYERPISPGRIYASVYTSWPLFQAIVRPMSASSSWPIKKVLKLPQVFLRNGYNFQLKLRPLITFFVMRDLRDTLISFYFSFKVSHPLLTDEHIKLRHTLESMNEEDGMLYLLDLKIDNIANIQRSWLDRGVLIVKYEDLIKNEYNEFERIFDYCKIKTERSRLHEVVSSNSFEKATGRKPGTENINAHLRKGIAGDWQNHFTEHLKKEFKLRYSDTLIRTGYETDSNW